MLKNARSRITMFLFVTMVTITSVLAASNSDRRIVSSYHLSNEHPAIVTVPKELKEISGIAVDETGRLFANQDERGTVYEIDASSGAIKKRFSIGKGRPVRGDFEDIAIVGKTFYLLTSAGKLYEFLEGENNGYVSYAEYSTGISKSGNYEGMCFDPASGTLLISSKNYPNRKHQNQRAIYSFSLKDKIIKRNPRFIIDLRILKAKYGVENFHPTALAVHPQSGNLLVLSSHVPSVIEMSASGEIIGCVKFPRNVHDQPEGMAFLPDQTLLISNEGSRLGRLVRYPSRK